jgi:peptidoglycan/xylan/chitin deacetylase (PgdA/CDA1 family)
MTLGTRSALVLLYHRVRDSDRDPHALVVRPDRFAEHMEYLRRNLDVVPLTEIRTPARHRRVAITFDDGYADNAEVAGAILASCDLPATLFVATGGLDAGTEFWWDRLEHLAFEQTAADFLQLDIGERHVRIDVRTPAGQARAIRALNRRLRALPPGVIEEALGAIESQTGHKAVSCGAHRRLSTDELRDIATRGPFEIGGHTRNHPRLAALAPDEQQREIEENRETLERVLGRMVPTFAYPFGSPGTFDATTVKLVRKAGYELACANVPGRVSRWTDRYRLPRHLVGDWSREELGRRLDAWFEGPS